MSSDSPIAGAARDRYRAGACLLVCISACSLAACGGSAKAVLLPVPPGTPDVYRITCDKRISTCREKAEEVCDGSYEVLETTGASIEPQRVTTAPGPRSTGPRYQRPKWLGHMVVSCGNAPPAASAEVRSSADLAGQPAQGAAAPRAHGACVPGTTQQCLGPGACRGAQACLPDGNGYSECDCGEAQQSSRSDIVASPALRAVDAGAPLDRER